MSSKKPSTHGKNKSLKPGSTECRNVIRTQTRLRTLLLSQHTTKNTNDLQDSMWLQDYKLKKKKSALKRGVISLDQEGITSQAAVSAKCFHGFRSIANSNVEQPPGVTWESKPILQTLPSSLLLAMSVKALVMTGASLLAPFAPNHQGLKWYLLHLIHHCLGHC